MGSYQDFISGKSYKHMDAGFQCGDLPDGLKDFQRDCVAWACRRGRAALFADTGLGKTFMQLAWASEVEQHTNRPVLIVTPLCVAQQTVAEGAKFGIDCKYMREPGFSNARIHVTNYEMLKNFSPDNYAGIVLDESSILKGMDGKLRKAITSFAETIPYRLSCTATPSPNDFMELGTQSEFLGVMSQVEMLATFFIHDGSDTQKWRLKGHGRSRFWEWLSTWSIVIRNPSDLGYDGDGYDLPPLNYVDHIVETGVTDGLFVKVAQGLQERNQARRESIDQRVEKAAELVNSMTGPCIVWCNLNEESEKLENRIYNGVQVVGSDSQEFKELANEWFTSKWIPKSGESNTCANTTKTTSTNTKGVKRTTKKETPEEGKDTRKMLSIEANKRRQLGNSKKKTQKQDSIKDSNNTELTPKNTGECCASSAEGAPFAERNTLAVSRERGCTSTTATGRELSEVCCAPTATRGSENSETRQNDSEQQQSTLNQRLISKPRIYGYGLNWQHCNQMVFVGLSDSWESFYQAVRRCWRFGQDRPVTVHIVTADTEGAVLDNIRRKQQQNDQMAREMALVMRDYTIAEIKGAAPEKTDYRPMEPMKKPQWG